MRLPLTAGVLATLFTGTAVAQDATPGAAAAPLDDATLAADAAVAADAALAGDAAATPAEKPSFATVMRGAANRARRAIALGPSIGVAVAVPTEGASDGLDVPISVGFALSLFHVPIVPDRKLVEDLIRSRVRVRLQERLVEAMAGRQERLQRSEIEQLALQVYKDVVAEVLGLHERRGRTFEKPRVAFALEAVFAPRASDIGVRATLRFGLGPISIGPTFLVAAESEGAQPYFGGEVAIAAMPGRRGRANVYELAVRGETGAVGDGPDAVVSLSVRALLDVL